MFEDNPKKFTDILNNYFTKNPVIFTLVLSAVISLLVFIISLDYRRGDAQVRISNSVPEGGGTGVSSEIKDIIKVDLSGAVKNPGIYSLKADSRLGELLSLGGGFTSEASSLWVSKNLNLSQIVSDGQKIYIPFDWDISNLEEGGEVKALALGPISAAQQKALVDRELGKISVDTRNGGQQSSPSSSPSSSSEPTPGQPVKVNVNTATSSELDKLPGIGPAYAGRVIEYRPYANFEEFKANSNLSASLCDSLKDLISY